MLHLNNFNALSVRSILSISSSLLVMLQLSDLHISGNARLILNAGACVGVMGAVIWAYLRKSGSRLPLPPSPPTRRLLGHLLPPRSAFLTVARWIDEYGPLITVRSGIHNVVIIGRYKAAIDILEKQGKISVDRPNLVGAEILARGLIVSLARAGDSLRQKRRVLHTQLQPKSAEMYQPLQMSQAKIVMLSILDDPANFQTHVSTYSAVTVTKITYGKTTPVSATHPDVLEARLLLKSVGGVARHGNYLVDSIPWLKYLPWYAPDLREEYERTTRRYTKMLNRVRQQMQRNEDIGPSFSKYILENQHQYGLTDIETAYLSGAIYAAGIETTSMAICTVLMAAAKFPEEQAKVQAELDAVIGRERAPTFADKPLLPRLEAFISEAVRWRPMIAAGGSLIRVQHRTDEDIIWARKLLHPRWNYGGRQPLGHLSRSRYLSEPEEFKPQRWIDDQGRLREDLGFFTFGFGRRICPGLHVANRSIFINTLLILWAFELRLDPTKPLDDTGFIYLPIPTIPCAIKFQTRIPESEIRLMMENY
ncbi:cytochrome P450 [Suillus spraguei]|nr:cytochrome P450 [Suillus spraguei]